MRGVAYTATPSGLANQYFYRWSTTGAAPYGFDPYANPTSMQMANMPVALTANFVNFSLNSTSFSGFAATNPGTQTVSVTTASGVEWKVEGDDGLVFSRTSGTGSGSFTVKPGNNPTDLTRIFKAKITAKSISVPITFAQNAKNGLQIKMGSFSNATVTVDDGSGGGFVRIGSGGTIVTGASTVGSTIRFTVSHSVDYELTGWTVTSSDGTTLAMNVYPPYQFTMPNGNVTITPTIVQFADIEGVVDSPLGSFTVETHNGTLIWALSYLGATVNTFALDNNGVALWRYNSTESFPATTQTWPGGSAINQVWSPDPCPTGWRLPSSSDIDWVDMIVDKQQANNWYSTANGDTRLHCGDQIFVLNHAGTSWFNQVSQRNGFALYSKNSTEGLNAGQGFGWHNRNAHWATAVKVRCVR